MMLGWVPRAPFTRLVGGCLKRASKGMPKTDGIGVPAFNVNKRKGLITIIPVKDRLIDIDNLEGEEIEFGIGDPRWVMKTQADLYSDITTAIIREYSTNAYDANVMAGNSDPINVTLPSILNPYFVVEDKGVGMTKALLKQVYTQFGVSDKRDSTKTNGMLGYGSKSGVAYTTQFTVTTVKDGTKLECVIQRKPDWRIVLKVITESKTSEANGTRISVPVHNIDEFNQKARDFYKYWLPGRVLINGAPSIHEVGKKIFDGMYHSTSSGDSRVVMGNVAYRIHNAQALFRDSRLGNLSFVVYADEVEDSHGETVAAVEFTPSREDLKYTDHTKNTLKKLVSKFEQEILKKAQAEVDAAKDHAEAFMVWQEWRAKFTGTLFNELIYRGEKVEESFKLPDDTLFYQTRNNYGRKQVTNQRQYMVLEMPNTMIVTHYGPFDVHSSVRSKVKQYARDQNWSVNKFIFLRRDSDEIESVWIPRDKIASYDEVKEATKIVTVKATVPKRISGSWDYWDRAAWHSQKPLPTNSKMLYADMSDTKFNARGNRLINPEVLLGRHFPNEDIVVLNVPGNRKDKLLRENPEIKHIRDYVIEEVINKMKPVVISDEVKAVYGLGYTEAEWYENLDPAKLDDPVVGKVVKALDELRDIEVRLSERETVARSVGSSIKSASFGDGTYTRKGYLLDKYPLLRPYTYSITNKNMLDEIYLYMNAKYAEGKNVQV